MPMINKKFKFTYIQKELLNLHKENIQKYKIAIENIEDVYENYGWGRRKAMFECLKDDLRELELEYNSAKLKILFRRIKNIRPSKSKILGKKRSNDNKNNLRIEF